MAKAKKDNVMTLTEVSKETGISMPTLQRYKKLYQDRIPSVGEGRTQRYKPESIKVFKELKEENIKKRGRPRKNATTAKPAAAPKKGAKPGPKAKSKVKAKTKAASKAAKPKKKSAKADGDLLTLTEISKTTAISYPTLLRYVKSNLANLPHRGSGRGRRYQPAAVDVFRQMRKESRRGRPAASSTARKAKATGRPAAAQRSTGTDATLIARLKTLESNQKALLRKIDQLEKVVRKPLQLIVRR